MQFGNAALSGIGTTDTISSNWHTNNLLRALQSEDFAQLKPHLRSWEGKAGDVIYEPGDHVQHAYFPCGRAMISYMVMLADGRGVETALIGREGAAGGIVSNGTVPAFSRTVVQVSGSFLRIELRRLEEIKIRSVSCRHLFARYADSLFAQIFQSVACNAVHTIEQRAARWILATRDRTGTDEIALTQEQLAGMLGVGRSYVNRVMGVLKREGVVDTRRRTVIIKDVEGLQNISCECSAAIRNHFEEVLQGVYPTDSESRKLTA